MNNISVPSMQDLLTAGAHFGHKVSRGHPKMKQFIFGAKDGIHIIDLAHSEEKLKLAAEAAYNVGKQGKVMLMVGTKKQARQIVEEAAKDAETPYLTNHWIGGLLTNFEEIRKNFKKLITLKEEQVKGGLDRYTKKERLLISKRLNKFDNEFGGIANMDALPQALFIVDPLSNDSAVKEARRMGILLIGFSDTNVDPNWFDYPIPANDDGIKSIKIVVETIANAYKAGKKEAKGIADKAAAEEEAKKEQAEDAKLTEAVVEETAALEEEIEKEVVSEKKV